MSKKKRARRAATQKMQRNGTTVSARELESKERQQPPPQNVDIDESIERLIDRSLRKRIAWLRRPRLDTAFFEEVCNDEQLAKVNHFVPEAPERARQIREASKNLGWSSERISLFKELAVEYRQRPSIENYLKVRHLFPDVEILLDRLVGPESFFALEKHFEKQGVDPELVAAGTLDADEPGVDALSLRLLECLVARDDIEKGRPGYIDRRRNAISDTTVGYLIAMMLEGLDRSGELVRLPPSLIVLIQHQLCGSAPDLEREYRSGEERSRAAVLAAQQLRAGERLTLRTFSRMTGVPRTTAARWLADSRFKARIEQLRQAFAEGKISIK